MEIIFVMHASIRLFHCEFMVSLKNYSDFNSKAIISIFGYILDVYVVNIPVSFIFFGQMCSAVQTV